MEILGLIDIIGRIHSYGNSGDSLVHNYSHGNFGGFAIVEIHGIRGRYMLILKLGKFMILAIQGIRSTSQGNWEDSQLWKF